jgi:predicted outer membrane repeat protein
MTLTNSVIFSNTADQWGGGMFNLHVSPVINSVFFTNNSAKRGGAMYNDGKYGESSPVLTDLAFSGNSATFGGALYNEGFSGISNPNLINVTFSGNSGSYGGAMCSSGGFGESDPTLTNVTFSGNSGTYGGAMYNEGSWGRIRSILTNVTFSGNSAGQNGGAMYNDGRYGQCISEVHNSILWNNQANGVTGTITATIYNLTATTEISHSLVEGSDGSGPNWECDDCTDGGGNIDQDPLFLDPVSPSSAPTTTGNLRLGEGSPAIDAGLNIHTENTGVLTDLDGEARFKDGDADGVADVDMGAYEADTHYLLSVSKTGTGDGKVSSSPTGIDCGATCIVALKEGSTITLTATANVDSLFLGWSEDCSGEGDCKISMDAAKNVTAAFDLEPAYKINLPLVKR